MFYWKDGMRDNILTGIRGYRKPLAFVILLRFFDDKTCAIADCLEYGFQIKVDAIRLFGADAF